MSTPSGKDASDTRKQNRGGVWVLAQIPLLLLAFGLPAVFPARLLPWPPEASRVRVGLGDAAGLSGLLLLALGLLGLGRSLTPFPRPKADSELVTTGVYGLVRHPVYGGVVLLALATAFHARTWLTLPIVAAVLVFFDRKANVEERWLTEQFTDYPHYRMSTAKLLPWLY